MPNSLELAKIAYHAYGQTTDFKNYQGLPMSEWENLPEKIQQAWIAASQAISSEFYLVLGKAVLNNEVLRNAILSQLPHQSALRETILNQLPPQS
ncbi:MAG: hypothetical protein V7K67_27780 [Nostoc sp.]|uniref:hypothetical protein n=1 Tax=Nostoc sp. TaxID=1180 RepID=UPI002FF6BA58